MHLVLENGKYYAFAETADASQAVSVQPVMASTKNDKYTCVQNLYHNDGQGLDYPFWKCFASSATNNFWWFYTSNLGIQGNGDLFCIEPISVTKIDIATPVGTFAEPNYYPSKIQFMTSTDGGTWVSSGDFTHNGNNAWTCTPTRNGKFNYFRIQVTARTNYAQIGRITFTGTGSNSLILRGVI